ncbi:DUF2330 domain-containing protein [Myxococcota bacterium]|nr:DUF2330 domain-containing protein [Myxococcota bacterium]
MRRLTSTLLLALSAAAPLVDAAPAHACGGFFRAETPVDQSAQRMIFKRLTASRLEAYFEIRFSGDPKSFAWVLPVPGIPQDKATVDVAVFEQLDAATAPQVIQPIVCEALGSPPTDNADAGFDAGAGGGEPEVNAPRVTVLDREVVGAYETVTLAAETGTDLVTWLREKGFRVTDEMIPFVDLYIGQGLNFLAARLKPEAGVDGIQPLKMTYDARGPMVPLKLASIAAQPETGVKIFYLGEERVTPSNTPELTVPTGHLAFDHGTQTGNWPAAVARTIDDHGGEGLVVDFAGPTTLVRTGAEENPIADADENTEPVRAALEALLTGTRYVTRFYARYSPEEMGVDVGFEAAPNLGDVERIRSMPELSCEEDPPPVNPCDFQACGLGGYCVLTTDATGAQVPACACVDGAAARAVRDDVAPGGLRVSCVDVRINVDPIELPDQVVDTPPVVGPPLLDPCAANPCGENGECFALNGHQTCLCERGYVAVAVEDGSGGLKATCRVPDQDVPDDFYRRRLPEPRLPYPRGAGGGNATATLSDDGCTQGAPDRGARHAAWALLLALPLVLRRRGRRD